MIYTYGCSFTYGSGIRPEPLFDGGYGKAFLGTEEYQDYTWVKELGRLLDMKITNRGLGGTSNSWILEKIIDDLNNFTKEDIIIIGETDAPRYAFPLGSGDEEGTGYLHVVPQAAEWLWKYDDNGGLKFDYAGHLLSKDDADSLLNYYLYLFPKHTEFYKALYRRHFNNILEFLNKQGFKTIFWEHTCWGFFERLDTWTNNKCKDGHWSPNGHLEFASILKYCLDHNINHLSDNNIPELLSSADLPDIYLRY